MDFHNNGGRLSRGCVLFLGNDEPTRQILQAHSAFLAGYDNVSDGSFHADCYQCSKVHRQH
jgi:hypothetical protein